MCFPTTTAEVQACVRGRQPPRRAVRPPRLGHRAGRRGGPAGRGGRHLDDEDEPASCRSTSPLGGRGSSRACSTSTSAARSPADGLHFAPDPSSQQTCSIGGNVANNSGGPHCLAEGVTQRPRPGPRGRPARRQRRRARRRGPGARRATTCAASSSAARGCSAIATQVLRPADAEPAGGVHDADGLRHRRGRGVDGQRRDRRRHRPGGDGDDGPAVPAGRRGLRPRRVAGRRRRGAAGRGRRPAARRRGRHGGDHGRSPPSTGVRTVRVAADDAERALLWKGRKSAFGAIARIKPNYYLHDTVVPRSRLPEVLAAVYEISARHDLLVLNVFHAGDGNLHPLLVYDGREPGVMERVHAAGEEIVRVSVEAGGVLSGEHGIGLEKRDLMPLMFSAVDLAAQDALRAAFDPARRGQPGQGAAQPGPLRRPAGRREPSPRARGSERCSPTRSAAPVRSRSPGSGTRGGPVTGVRTVGAPAGIEWIEPAEMTVTCGAGTIVAELDDALAGPRPVRGHPADRHRRRRAGRRPQRVAPPRLRPGARRRAAGALRVGRRRGRQGRRPDGQERQRVRPVPAARRVARDARLPRRRHPADPAAGALRAVVRRRRRSGRGDGPAVPTDVRAVGRHHRVGAAGGRSARRRPIRSPALPARRRRRAAGAADGRAVVDRARRAPPAQRAVRRRARRRHRAPRGAGAGARVVDPVVRDLHRRIKDALRPDRVGSTRASTCSMRDAGRWTTGRSSTAHPVPWAKRRRRRRRPPATGDCRRRSCCGWA